MNKFRRYEAVVIGVSAGGINALETILPAFSADYRPAVLIVQHIAAEGGRYLLDHFSSRCSLPVREAMDKEKINAGTIYFAPPNYHFLVEKEQTIALSTQEKIHYCRPSIDVLFETAAEAYCEKLVGVILTGANVDGAAGLARVKQLGGLTVVQSPETAKVETMPKAAIGLVRVDHILKLFEIGPFLAALNKDCEV